MYWYQLASGSPLRCAFLSITETLHHCFQICCLLKGVQSSEFFGLTATRSDGSKPTDIQTTMQLVNKKIKHEKEKKRGRKNKAGSPYIQPHLIPNKGRDHTSGATLSNSANKANIVGGRASTVTAWRGKSATLIMTWQLKPAFKYSNALMLLCLVTGEWTRDSACQRQR